MTVADRFSPAERSRIMSSVGSRDTEPEMTLRRALWSSGLRYRTQRKVAGVRVDLCFVGARVVVMVDGCFWHGCPRHYSKPLSNGVFWANKLKRNRRRDRANDRNLAAAGWTVLRVWECQIREDLESCVNRVREAVTGG